MITLTTLELTTMVYWCFTLINLYLVHFLQATPEIHTMAKFLMELCVTEYSMLHFLPSHLAAAALNLAMKAYSAGEWVSPGV